MAKYSSKTFFTYEADLMSGLAPGQVAQFAFNTHGDSDFFWQKFAAFALVDGNGTTRSADQLPAVSMNVLNQTTGRSYMNGPAAIPNIGGFLQFVPQMVVWPRKSSILLTLENVDAPQVVGCNSSSWPYNPALGLENDGTNEFYGVSLNWGQMYPTGNFVPSAPSISGQNVLIIGTAVIEPDNTVLLYVNMDGGAQDLFEYITTQEYNGGVPIGPIYTYNSDDALFGSGVIDGIDVTSSGPGPSLWTWSAPENSFLEKYINVTFYSAGETTYSSLQLSFMGTKAFN